MLNEEVYQALQNEGTPIVKDELNRLESEGRLNDENVYALTSSYPTFKNEFISALTNKVLSPNFYSKIYRNKLQSLHKGLKPFGQSMEQIFVEMGKRKGFYEHFEKQLTDGTTQAGTAESDLISKHVPPVHTLYITQNFAHKYKVTISEEMLQKAFLNPEGLGQMVNQLIMSNTNGAYRDEYRDMLGILTLKTAESTETDGHKYEQGLIYQYALDDDMSKAIIPTGSDPKEYCKQIRIYAEKLTFDSDKYNLAKITTWTNTEEFIHITTPENNADIDVNVIANAFNVSSTDVKVRTIIVDELPKDLVDSKGASLGAVKGILADKEIMQVYDLVNQTAEFPNPNELSRSYFLHKQGLMCSCKFCNMVIFTDKAVS